MQEMETKENQIIHGVIWKQLLIFFFPILLGTFFQNRGFGSSWWFNQPDH